MGQPQLRVLHWSSTHPAVEDAFRRMVPPDWHFASARGMSAEERAAALRAADAVIVVNLDLRGAEVARLDRCRIVVHQGVGTDNVDTAALEARGIPIAVTPAGTTDEVAEYAVLLMLAVSRRLKEISADVDSGRAWPTWSYRTRSRSMAGRRVGLVGFGRIGQAVAERLLAMKAEIHVFPGPRRGVPEEWRGRVAAAESVPALCGRVEIVSLHLPLRPDTVNILDAEALARLPAGALVINTARGPLIDEAEMAARLADGRLGGAGLDVLSAEPPPADHPLLGLPNVIVTPHLSSGTRDSLEAKVRSIIATIAGAFAA
jgi:phosphoglycerate dehydrogenase-like enzyme